MAVLAAFSEKEPAVDPQMRITMAACVRASTSIGCQRLEPVFSQDSGWCIGALDAEPERWESIRAADVLLRCPDFSAVLKLPIGFSVILDMNGLVAIRDPQRREVWRAAPSP
ncbi:MAG: immunity protein Imm33 domain-containing protein [Phycisphaerae bacterium]